MGELHATAVPEFSSDCTPAEPTRRPLSKAVIGVTLGNMVEWFDFALYSSLAGIIGKTFFHDDNPTAQLMAIYATFAAGFLIRPLGSLIFGPIGDKYGRRTALSLSISLMAVATFAIALIPGYASIGVAAPILLILMRLLQGLSTGGEYGGSCTFIAEHAPDKRRSFFTSWLEFGNISGFLLGGAIVSMFTLALGDQAMAEWGWRVPFALGGLLGLIALYLRLGLEETPVFKEIRNNEALHTSSAGEKNRLFRLMVSEWPQMLKCMGLVTVFNVTYYIVLGYIPGYLENVLGYSNSFALSMGLAATLFMLVLIPVSGHLADHLGRKRMILCGCVLLIVMAFPCFMLLHTGKVGFLFVALLTLTLAQLFFEGAMPATLTSLFSARVRYSALAISYNIAVSLFGGTAPLINTWLISATGNQMIPAWYLIAGAVVGLISILFIKDSTGKPLPK
ncbi:MFS transporter [Pseudomonas sp. LP_7_YM]|uniref:MFS transporter n=1 Tax=Pseudomonas sp. LP_7_YM TaxID=2485137 RepID=UPI00105E67EA|nr:MFS transporter [Pseudomonas sp. LP_7_YM]TDV72285.1 MHS family proline/betaine transporter-like MFS transporter [Pseudomonas sp. LP_7_YM]